MNSPDPTPAAAAEHPNGKRRMRLLILAAAVAVIGIGYGTYWLLHGRYFEETDDAYVATDLVQITSEVAGTVTAVHVDDTQHVERGQVLVELDRADAEVAMARAEAELASAVRQVRGLFSQADGLRAQIRQRDVQLSAARADLARRQHVGDDGAVSAEELQHARDSVAQLEAQLTVTRESLQTTRAQIEGTTIETNPQVLVAEAHVRDAALALKRTRIVAPVAGTVARRSVQLGSRIAPGTPLLAVVTLADAWVDANFKEGQLAQIRIGQPWNCVPIFTAATSPITAMSRAWVPAAVAPSPSFPPRMPAATGSRSCSAFPYALRSIRKSWSSIRCGSDCRCESRSITTTPRASWSQRRYAARLNKS